MRGSQSLACATHKLEYAAPPLTEWPCWAEQQLGKGLPLLAACSFTRSEARWSSATTTSHCAYPQRSDRPPSGGGVGVDFERMRRTRRSKKEEEAE